MNLDTVFNKKTCLIISRNSEPVFSRQTPGGIGICGNWEFHEGEPRAGVIYDALVVYNNIPKKVIIPLRSKRVLLVTAEPSSVLTYPRFFLEQFELVVSSQQDLPHPNVIVRATCLPWHIGIRKKTGLQHTAIGFNEINYDTLTHLNYAIKPSRISIITSAKTITSGHRKRLEFANSLKKSLGDRIDLFGAGIRHVEDKWDAIWPYKYHIAIENCKANDYWTEKLSDSYLGWSYPFYHGCPNLDRYLPDNAWRRIDIEDVAGSVKLIETVLDNGLSDQEISAMKTARRLMLDRYNLVPYLSQLFDKDPRLMSSKDESVESVTIRPFDPHYGERPSVMQRGLSRIRSVFK